MTFEVLDPGLAQASTALIIMVVSIGLILVSWEAEAGDHEFNRNLVSLVRERLSQKKTFKKYNQDITCDEQDK